MITETPQTPQPFWLYYINIEAIDAGAARATKAGGKICNGPLQGAPAHGSCNASIRRERCSRCNAKPWQLARSGWCAMQFGEPRCHLITVTGSTTTKSSRR
jgi:hypothetical protein